MWSVGCVQVRGFLNIPTHVRLAACVDSVFGRGEAELQYRGSVAGDGPDSASDGHRGDPGQSGYGGPDKRVPECPAVVELASSGRSGEG